MDAEFKEPAVLKKYGITLPPDYNKKDSLAVKIEKLRKRTFVGFRENELLKN
jgi:hypothetical protein